MAKIGITGSTCTVHDYDVVFSQAFTRRYIVGLNLPIILCVYLYCEKNIGVQK